MQIKNFCFNSDIKLDDLGNGVSRKILSYHNNLMIVEVNFEKGAIGAMHQHRHEQITYVLDGSFEFTIGDVTKVVSKGDSLYKEPNILHGAVCLEKGRLLDIFTPHREDFIK